MLGGGYFGGATPGKAPLFDDDETMFQRRLQQIAQITDPEQQQQAIEALARDYPGRIADLQSQQGFGETMAQTPMPRGRVAGSASNPFSVYIGANPLESAAAGAQQFMGHRERRKAMEGRQ